MTLQTRMVEHTQDIGRINFNSWRSFRNQSREATEPFRFIDGEMVERFLDLDEQAQASVAEGLGPSVEDMRSIIEELRRMH